MTNNSFIRFALVGVVNTAVGYGVIMLLHYGMRMSPLAANVGGYAVGGLLSYALNRYFTFASQRSHAQALPRFGLVAAGCFLLNLLVLHVGIDMLALPVGLAQALAVGTYTLVFYLASRSLFFHA